MCDTFDAEQVMAYTSALQANAHMHAHARARAYTHTHTIYTIIVHTHTRGHVYAYTAQLLGAKICVCGQGLEQYLILMNLHLNL